MPLYVTCPIIEDHTNHVSGIALGVKVAEGRVNIYNTLLAPAVLAARRGKALSDNRGH